MTPHRTPRTSRCDHCGSLYVPVSATSLDDRTIEERALAVLAEDLEGAPEDCWRFFETLWSSPRAFAMGKEVARHLGITNSTMASRFLRAGLPTPKRYIEAVAFVRIAGFLDTPGRSLRQAARHTTYSTQQAINRRLRSTTGLTACAYFAERSGPRLLDEFRDTLVSPYLTQLRDFSPLTYSRVMYADPRGAAA